MWAATGSEVSNSLIRETVFLTGRLQTQSLFRTEPGSLWRSSRTSSHLVAGAWGCMFVAWCLSCIYIVGVWSKRAQEATVIGWYSNPFQRLQQFPAIRQKLPETALPSLVLRDTIYGLVLWNPHRQGPLTAEVPPEKEGWRLSLEPHLDWNYSSQPCVCGFPIIVHGFGVSQRTGVCRLGEINWRGLHLFSYGFFFLIIFQSPVLLPDPFPYLINSPEKHIVFPGCTLRESFFGKDFQDPLRRGRYCLCHPREELFPSYTFQVWVVGSAG